jgi:polyhydroxyalkanoate synthesis regulator phasin
VCSSDLIWNENYATPLRASEFLNLANEHINDTLCEGVIRRLKPIKELSFDEAKAVLSELVDQAQKLHQVIKAHYGVEFETWLSREKLHPLQTIVLTKQIYQLKDIP